MYSFFVLGLIPGLNLQITFDEYLAAWTLVVGAAGLIWAHHQHEPVAHTNPTILQILHYETLLVLFIRSTLRRSKITALLIYTRLLVPNRPLRTKDNT